MNAPIIDLRTDFVSRPTPPMIAAMMEAAESPSSFGLRDDPFVRKLESAAATILGKDDALFCPTCAMANQIAIHVYCRPGDNFICDATSHIIVSEAGAASALSGALSKPIAPRSGMLHADDIVGAIHPGDPGRSRTSLIAIENTHVYSGGRVMDVKSMQTISGVAKKASVPVHLDGSRIFNAAAALGVQAITLAATADSIAVSMNKALAAPLGAILAGSKSFIEEAVRVRQMFGGGWRPCAIPAAAALVAIETMTGRLAEDHVHARRLAAGLAGHPLVKIDTDQVQTNIVHATVTTHAQSLVDRLQSRGILVLPVSSSVIRMVTYHNIGDGEIERTIDAFNDIRKAS